MLQPWISEGVIGYGPYCDFSRDCGRRQVMVRTSQGPPYFFGIGLDKASCDGGPRKRDRTQAGRGNMRTRVVQSAIARIFPDIKSINSDDFQLEYGLRAACFRAGPFRTASRCYADARARTATTPIRLWCVSPASVFVGWRGRSSSLNSLRWHRCVTSARVFKTCLQKFGPTSMHLASWQHCMPLP